MDEGKCIDCAGCIAVCPEGAIKNTWDRSHWIRHVWTWFRKAQAKKLFQKGRASLRHAEKIGLGTMN
jgi:Fe-S-cluster-containing hydrogenase component 2